MKLSGTLYLSSAVEQKRHSSDIRSEGSIAIVKKFDFNFFMNFDSTSLPYLKKILRNLIRFFGNAILPMLQLSLENKQEDPLRSYSLVSAIVSLFVLVNVLKFVETE